MKSSHIGLNMVFSKKKSSPKFSTLFLANDHCRCAKIPDFAQILET